MVLAQNVVTAQGRQLFPLGYEIKGNERRIFLIWGIEEVYVSGDQTAHLAEQTIPEQDNTLREAADKLADAVFVDVQQGGEDDILRTVFIENAGRAMQEKGIESVVRSYGCGAPATKRPAPGNENIPIPEKEDLLNRELNIGALPESVSELLEAINKHYSASAVAGVIARDLGLSLKLIRIVNSAFYSFPEPVDNLTRAVTIIGQRQLLTLVLSISAINTFKHIKGTSISASEFWEHSLCCGIISKCLAEHTGLADVEKSFLTGLLHDIGRLLVLKHYPHMFIVAAEMAEQEKCSLHVAEKQLWGYDHAELGADLLTLWNLPKNLCESIRYHHEPRQGEEEETLLHLADATTKAANMGNSGVRRIPFVGSELWRDYAISPKILSGLIESARSQSASLLNLLL